MGNCLKCFKSSSSENTGNHTIGGVTTTPNVASGQQNSERARGDTNERGETDELLTPSPIHITNFNSESLKKSQPHLNHNFLTHHTMGEILTTAGGGRDPSGIGSGILGGNLNTTIGNQLAQLGKDLHQISDNTLNALFEEYKDPHEDAILLDGIERLCCDLGYKPDDFAILVLAWQLDASQMCRFTKAEFIHGLHNMNADTMEGIRLRLEQIIEKTKCDKEMFKLLYRFTFKFGLEPMLRILSLEMAVILWRLVFTIHTPDILDRWLNFLERHPNIRGIPKDTWNMFLNFAETCDITSYDDTEAWPSLFDDFVEYETDRTNQNVKADKLTLSSTTALGREGGRGMDVVGGGIGGVGEQNSLDDRKWNERT